MPQPQGFRGQTVRQAVRLRRGGTLLRLVLSNEFGHAPLVIDRVTVSGAREKSVRTAALRGSSRWEIPPGQVTGSDPGICEYADASNRASWAASHPTYSPTAPWPQFWGRYIDRAEF
jgi:hypothetical protein